jgi:hypothetical protein
MAVIKYDVSGVEAGGGGEQPQPGLYKGKIVSVTPRKKKSNGDPTNDLEVVVDVGKEYSRLWTYIQLDNPASAWKLREFTDALGLPDKGGFDPTKLGGKQVSVKVAADTDLDGDYRGKVKNLFAPSDNGSEPASADGEATDYSEWTVDELVAEIESRDLEMPSGRKTVEKLAAILTEADEDAADDAPTDEYDEWTTEDLSAEAETRGIIGNISGRKTQAKLIEALRADDAGPSNENADPDNEEPVDDYDEWSEQELHDEVETRNNEANAEIEIKGRVTKEKIIAALRADDSSAEPF